MNSFPASSFSALSGNGTISKHFITYFRYNNHENNVTFLWINRLQVHKFIIFYFEDIVKWPVICVPILLECVHAYFTFLRDIWMEYFCYKVPFRWALGEISRKTQLTTKYPAFIRCRYYLIPKKYSLKNINLLSFSLWNWLFYLVQLVPLECRRYLLHLIAVIQLLHSVNNNFHCKSPEFLLNISSKCYHQELCF